jgi:BON domain
LRPINSKISKTATEADNTKQNSSEENKKTETAEKQSNNKDDVAMTQKIRQAVMKDGSLSMNAKNVKIIAQDGKITLKGPVESQQEKDTIGSDAGEIAGSLEAPASPIMICPCSSPIREAPAISLIKKKPRCLKVRRSAPVREVWWEVRLDCWPVSGH